MEQNQDGGVLPTGGRGSDSFATTPASSARADSFAEHFFSCSDSERGSVSWLSPRRLETESFAVQAPASFASQAHGPP